MYSPDLPRIKGRAPYFVHTASAIACDVSATAIAGFVCVDTAKKPSLYSLAHGKMKYG